MTLAAKRFLERVWAWKEKYGSRIVEQQRKLGVSCDWSRSRFTMDEGCSKAVREAFCEMYDKGLIYKGSRIINWCPHCLTALSDAEVEYVDKPGHLWYIRYPLSDGSGDIVVATTRPETMMGDTGVAVNPNDEKFKHLIGKTCILPIMNREIPIVGDEYCEIGFGTGAVKMTPAHDPNDFEVGLRHNLDVIRVIADDGHINENGGKYNGMDRYECRKALVKDLEEQGYLVKTEPYSHNVGTCYRCHNDVEPLISAQWFVKDEAVGRRGYPRRQERHDQICSRALLQDVSQLDGKMCTTGASPASFGGAIRSPRGTAMRAAISTSAAKTRRSAKSAAARS